MNFPNQNLTPLPISRNSPGLEKTKPNHLSIFTDCFKNTERNVVQQYLTKLHRKTITKRYNAEAGVIFISLDIISKIEHENCTICSDFLIGLSFLRKKIENTLAVKILNRIKILKKNKTHNILLGLKKAIELTQQLSDP